MLVDAISLSIFIPSNFIVDFTLIYFSEYSGENNLFRFSKENSINFANFELLFIVFNISFNCSSFFCNEAASSFFLSKKVFTFPTFLFSFLLIF